MSSKLGMMIAGGSLGLLLAGQIFYEVFLNQPFPAGFVYWWWLAAVVLFLTLVWQLHWIVWLKMGVAFIVLGLIWAAAVKVGFVIIMISFWRFYKHV